jgi:hypothetical protein
MVGLRLAPQGWTFVSSLFVTASRGAGRLISGDGRRLVVPGESEPGRYAPPGTIVTRAFVDGPGWRMS